MTGLQCRRIVLSKSILKSQSQPQLKWSRGFTLLELLLVVIIIAVLAGVMVPALVSNNERLLSEQAERMMLLINMAQQESVMTAKIWKVRIDPSTFEYSFLKLENQEFSLINDSPFNGANQILHAKWGELSINAENTSSAADVYLFPTGEHDPFSVKLSTGENHYTVAMGPIGPAYMR